MDRLQAISVLHRSSVRHRTESEDSGISGIADLPNLAMQRCRSDVVCSSQGEGSIQLSTTINEQTLLLLGKMQILDMKLQSMETHLKNEQLQRLALEAKVVKLEKDNERLKSVHGHAGKQLQSFAEMFYSETELLKLKGSCNVSPFPSQTELRPRSITDSLSSNTSGTSGSRLSQVSV